MDGRLIAITSQKGGVGKTTLATNMACVAARELQADVALLQLERPFAGDSTVLFGGERGATLGSLADALPEMTADMLAERLVRHTSGVVVVPAALDLALADLVTPVVAAEAIDLLLQAFPFVVADIGRGTDGLAAEALDRASDVIVPTGPDLLDVNCARKTLEFLQGMMYPHERIRVLLNREHDAQRISLKIIELNLGQPVSFSVPEDVKALAEASLQGQPLALGSRRHPITRALAVVVKELLSEEPLPAGTRIGVRRPVAESSPGRVAARPAAARAAVEEPGRAIPGLSADEVIDIKRAVHRRLVDEMNLRDVDYRALKSGPEARDLRLRAEQMIARLLDEEAPNVSDKGARLTLARDILNEALGLGPLEYYLADDTVSEVMVNSAEDIYIERRGRLEKTPHSFTGEEQLRTIIERIVVEVGRRIDENSPMVDARLPDGSRVNAVIPPLTLDGSVLTIRKFSTTPLGIKDLIGFGSLSDQMAEFLRVCVLARKNMVISGGTGSGKTTLLNVLSGYIPGDDRIVTIEDSAELQLPQDHVVRMETRPPNIEGEGAVTIRDLVRNSLRMRPDRIVVGECRGGEALDMLQAMNTGHDGSLTTVHANTPRDALARLETMSLMAGIDLPSKAIRDQIVAAIDVIVQQERLRDGSRRVVAISELTGMEGNVFTMQDLFEYKKTGMEGQKVVGHHQPTGLIPSFLDDLREQGFEVPREIFLHQMA
jgi:septum site-determining protein MinD